VSSLGEILLLCKEGVARQMALHGDYFASAPEEARATKPIGLEYLADRIATDDRMWPASPSPRGASRRGSCPAARLCSL